MTPENASNLNPVWAALLIEELVRGGVCGFCLTPGSRNTPLTLAVAENPRARRRTHFDERGAAFLALGWAKATGRPAVLICTSGSAVANCWPAVVEASMSHVPLVLLTADRPPELLACGANQAIDQHGIFGEYVRWSFTLPCPDAGVPAEMVLTTADQAIYRATRAPAGPVHLDCMFREPLTPPPGGRSVPEQCNPPAPWRNSGAPFTTWHLPETALTTEQDLELINLISRVDRGLLVLGSLPEEAAAAAPMLAGALAWPVFADVTSGLRLNRSESHYVHHYDQLLMSESFRARCAPEFVLHLGGPITSKRLTEHLAALRPEYVRVAEHPFRQDPWHQVVRRYEADLPRFCTWLAPSLQNRDIAPWCEEAVCASQTVSETVDQWLARTNTLNEIAVARLVSRRRPPESILFLANSMPLRDMDMFGAADGPAGLVVANRGASGIDGNIATAAGYALAGGQPVTAVLGDLAALHDLNSLALLRDTPAPVILVILNNNGAGIFSFLPIAEFSDVFEPYFGVPHGLNFRDAAACFGLPYECPETPDQFTRAYEQAIKSRRSSLLEVRTDRVENRNLHRELQNDVLAAADRMLRA